MRVLRDGCTSLPSWLVTPPSLFPSFLSPSYQLFDTLQAMCSDLRAGVTMQAAMVGAGVGNAAATVKGTMSVDIVVALLQQVVGFSVGSTCRADLSAATMKTWRV